MNSASIQKIREKVEAERKTRVQIFHRAALYLAPKMSVADLEILKNGLEAIWEEFRRITTEYEKIQSGEAVKDNLVKLSQKADELGDFISKLDLGTVEILNSAPITNHLLEYAAPQSLPNHDHQTTIKLSSSNNEHLKYCNEMAAGGLWYIRLKCLAELARQKTYMIDDLTVNRGNVTLAARLHGSLSDALARACWEFAEVHGCRKKIVAAVIYRTIMEAEYGEQAILDKYGRPSTNKGMKAIRRVASMPPEKGAI